eukprot:Gb_25486 [translate_table: standard]
MAALPPQLSTFIFPIPPIPPLSLHELEQGRVGHTHHLNIITYIWLLYTTYTLHTILCPISLSYARLDCYYLHTLSLVKPDCFIEAFTSVREGVKPKVKELVFPYLGKGHLSANPYSSSDRHNGLSGPDLIREHHPGQDSHPLLGTFSSLTRSGIYMKIKEPTWILWDPGRDQDHLARVHQSRGSKIEPKEEARQMGREAIIQELYLECKEHLSKPSMGRGSIEGGYGDDLRMGSMWQHVFIFTEALGPPRWVDLVLSHDEFIFKGQTETPSKGKGKSSFGHSKLNPSTQGQSLRMKDRSGGNHASGNSTIDIHPLHSLTTINPRGIEVELSHLKEMYAMLQFRCNILEEQLRSKGEIEEKLHEGIEERDQVRKLRNCPYGPIPWPLLVILPVVLGLAADEEPLARMAPNETQQPVSPPLPLRNQGPDSSRNETIAPKINEECVGTTSTKEGQTTPIPPSPLLNPIPRPPRENITPRPFEEIDAPTNATPTEEIHFPMQQEPTKQLLESMKTESIGLKKEVPSIAIGASLVPKALRSKRKNPPSLGGPSRARVRRMKEGENNVCHS